jgi:hypothetical protein
VLYFCTKVNNNEEGVRAPDIVSLSRHLRILNGYQVECTYRTQLLQPSSVIPLENESLAYMFYLTMLHRKDSNSVKTVNRRLDFTIVYRFILIIIIRVKDTCSPFILKTSPRMKGEQLRCMIFALLCPYAHNQCCTSQILASSTSYWNPKTNDYNWSATLQSPTSEAGCKAAKPPGMWTEVACADTGPGYYYHSVFRIHIRLRGVTGVV